MARSQKKNSYHKGHPEKYFFVSDARTSLKDLSTCQPVKTLKLQEGICRWGKPILLRHFFSTYILTQVFEEGKHKYLSIILNVLILRSGSMCRVSEKRTFVRGVLGCYVLGALPAGTNRFRLPTLGGFDGKESLEIHHPGDIPKTRPFGPNRGQWPLSDQKIDPRRARKELPAKKRQDGLEKGCATVSIAFRRHDAICPPRAARVRVACRRAADEQVATRPRRGHQGAHWKANTVALLVRTATAS